ncbi:MAG TPA: RDD family protein [Nitrolancea sp.]|nr:RDD family protein [Nitrolancea sp.]
MSLTVPVSVPATIIVRRAAAYAIDVAIAYGIFLAIQTGISPLRNQFGSNWMASAPLFEGYILLTISLPVWCYFAFSESSSWRATIGKRLLGLCVTDVSGKRLGLGRSVLRTAVKLLPWDLAHLTIALPAPLFIDPNSGALDWTRGEFRLGFIVVYALIGITVVTMLRTSRRQALHDLAASTVVLHRPKRERGSDASP